MRGTYPSSILGALFVAVVALMLSGCAPAAGPAPVASAHPWTPTTSKPPAASESAVGTQRQPVLVVAGVDVDGKHVTASGYVAGVVANGGQCQFVFTQAGASVSAETTGKADRMTTSCGAVHVPIARFGHGSWTVTLDYAPGSREIHSAPMTVEIP